MINEEIFKKAMRDNFEKWMTDDGKWMKAIEKNKDGNYILMQTSSHWSAWQAGWESRHNYGL